MVLSKSSYTKRKALQENLNLHAFFYEINISLISHIFRVPKLNHRHITRITRTPRQIRKIIIARKRKSQFKPASLSSFPGARIKKTNDTLI